MSWITLAFGAALSWGLYGASLHRGQTALGNPLKAMLCVGVAYFLIAVLVPVAALVQQGELRNFNLTGTVTATLAGALGALGAVCITYAFRAGGTPFLVMPLVFVGAAQVSLLAQNWPHWRGPSHNGVSTEKNLPDTWSAACAGTADFGAASP